MLYFICFTQSKSGANITSYCVPRKVDDAKNPVMLFQKSKQVVRKRNSRPTLIGTADDENSRQATRHLLNSGALDLYMTELINPFRI